MRSKNENEIKNECGKVVTIRVRLILKMRMRIRMREKIRVRVRIRLRPNNWPNNTNSLKNIPFQ